MSYANHGTATATTADRNACGIAVNQFTRAPLRIERTIHIAASLDAVFAVLARQEEMPQWVPMLKNVHVNHERSTNGRDNYGPGTARVCQFGPDTLKEKIVVWDPPIAYAYQAQNNADASDHLGVVTCEIGATGRTQVTWRQYYNPRNLIKAVMLKLMMGMVLKRALRNLKQRVEAGVR
jgi:uncharacterized membrane protein